MTHTHSEAGDDDHCSFFGPDLIDFRYRQITSMFDTREKFVALPMHEERLSKLDQILMEMLDRLSTDLVSIDMKKEFRQTGIAVEMLYQATLLTDMISKLEDAKSASERISEFIDKLMVHLEETHLDKEY